MALPPWALPATAGAAALAAWFVFKDGFAMKNRAGAGTGRTLAGAAAANAVLPIDASLPQLVPEHLLHFGPPVLPPHYVPHRHRYSDVPGRELQRLMFGAPGACSPQVPREMRGWIFCPPAEEDY